MNDIEVLQTKTVNEIEKEAPVMALAAKISELKQVKIFAIKNEETKQVAMNTKIICKNLRKEIDALRKEYGEPFRLIVESVNGFFKMMVEQVKGVEDTVDEKLKNYQAKQPTAFANGKVEKGVVYTKDVIIIDEVDIKKLAGAVAKGDVPADCLSYNEKNIKKALDLGMKIPGVKWHNDKDIVGR